MVGSKLGANSVKKQQKIKIRRKRVHDGLEIVGLEKPLRDSKEMTAAIKVPNHDMLHDEMPHQTKKIALVIDQAYATKK